MEIEHYQKLFATHYSSKGCYYSMMKTEFVLFENFGLH